MIERLRASYHVVIPCLLVAALAAPIVDALLPDQSDELTESYEPAKTLTFIYTHGTAFHKWGPLPSILYAPFYTPFVGYWYVAGQFHKPTGSFLSAFSHPFEQLGTLILLARIIGLLAGILSVAVYSRAIARVTMSRKAALGAMLLCVATAPDLIYEFTTTKPDGLMMAALTLAMAVYGIIIVEGFSLYRGALLALCAVASVSCKEQAASAFAAMFLWILLSSKAPRARFLRDYGMTLLIGAAAYLVIDVVYAPGAWWQHIQYWTTGPGKDPAVWAPPDYTRAAFLRDGIMHIFFNLGPGGSAAVIVGLIASGFCLSRQLLGAWIPFGFYLVVVYATVGDVPRYYMLPVTVLSALPIGLLLARFEERWTTTPLLRVCAAGVWVAAALNLWNANVAWAEVRQRPEWMMEHYAASHISKDQTISLANPWKVPAGSSRLSYLGYKVDDRPLGMLMENPEGHPDYILISREWENWLAAFGKRPARNELYKGTGYSYSAFDGMPSLGYQLQQAVHPEMPSFLLPWPPNDSGDKFDLMVYRRVSAAR